MPRFKITAKRQATISLETYEALGIGPGDIVHVEPRMIDGEEVGELHHSPAPDRSWVAAMKGQTQSEDHSTESIRRSIAVGRQKESA